MRWEVNEASCSSRIQIPCFFFAGDKRFPDILLRWFHCSFHEIREKREREKIWTQHLHINFMSISVLKTF